MKIAVIILIVISVCAMLICGCLFDKPHEVYANCGIIDNVDYTTDIVSVRDFQGFVWQFTGCEDWDAGDICAMVMDNNATPDTIFDDVIISTNYCGWSF